MANWLKMDKHNAALGLARQGWSFRRIGAELGIDRGTVARHVRAAAAQQPGRADHVRRSTESGKGSPAHRKCKTHRGVARRHSRR